MLFNPVVIIEKRYRQIIKKNIYASKVQYKLHAHRLICDIIIIHLKKHRCISKRITLNIKYTISKRVPYLNFFF